MRDKSTKVGFLYLYSQKKVIEMSAECRGEPSDRREVLDTEQSNKVSRNTSAVEQEQREMWSSEFPSGQLINWIALKLRGGWGMSSAENVLLFILILLDVADWMILNGDDEQRIADL